MQRSKTINFPLHDLHSCWAKLRSPFRAGVGRSGVAKNDVELTCDVVSTAGGQEERWPERDLAMCGVFIVAGYSLKILPI